MSASIEVQIRTPAVPKTLTVEMPGAHRGSPLTLDHFTDKELDQVIAGYGEDMKALAAKMQKEAHDRAIEEAEAGAESQVGNGEAPEED